MREKQGTTMKVFTSHRIARIEHKYRNHPIHRRPVLYKIAIDPHREDQRRQIEVWVNQFIPDTEKESFATKLCSDSFQSIFNELIVADKLSQLGHEVKYQLQLQNKKTPDWFVETFDKSVSFYVEVFTPSPPEEISEAEHKWLDLCTQIEKERLGVGIQIEKGRDSLPPDPKHVKILVSLVSRWTKQQNVTIGAHVAFHHDTLEKFDDGIEIWRNSIKFEICETNINPESSWCSPPFEMHRVDVNSLKTNIEKKIKKYGAMLSDQELSFVVCLVPHPQSLFDHNSIEDALYGQSITYIDSQSQIFISRENNGVFTGNLPKNATLSAVIWLQRAEIWQIGSDRPINKYSQVYLNPKSTIPISQELLDFKRLKK